MTAVMLLEALNPKFAEAQVIPKDDARLTTEFVSYPSPQGYETTRGYLVKPKGATGKLPGILVVHENRGLNPHIEDIARRLALENYIVFAPDALAPLGGYPGDEDKARALFATLEQPKTREDMAAAFRFLKGHPGSTGKVGAVGFCYGGGITHMLATKLPDLAARGAVLRQQPAAGDGGHDQGTAARAPGGEGRAHQRGLARVRGRAQGRQREVHGARVPGRAARLQQRHHAALRRGLREARLDAHAGVLREEPPRLMVGAAL